MKRVAIVASGWKKLINYGWISGFKQYIKDSGAEISLHFFIVLVISVKMRNIMTERITFSIFQIWRNMMVLS